MLYVFSLLRKLSYAIIRMCKGSWQRYLTVGLFVGKAYPWNLAVLYTPNER